MQTLIRTLIILAAALVVCGATFGLVQSGVVSSVPAGARPIDRFIQGESGGAPALSGQQAAQSGAPGPRGGAGREGRGGFSLFGLAEVLRSFGVVAVIVALFALGGRIRRGRRDVETAAFPESSLF